MTLAVMALYAEGTTRLTNIASWRVKETDRIAAMAAELRKLGATVEEGADSIAVTAPAPGAWRAGVIHTHDDHRIAMCLSLAAFNPLVATPGHDSWPSGHSTESFAVARVLATLCPDAGPQLRAHAARIAQNREVAGVHFPTDSAAGAVLGDTLARFVIAVGEGRQAPEKEVRSATFDSAVVYHGGPLRQLALDTWVEEESSKGPLVWNDTLPVSAAEAGYIAELWRQAQAEWV
jgi:hypothetical protein